MILTPAEMQAAEAALFATGIEPESLMEKAGIGIARFIRSFFPNPGTLHAYLGKGHNADDALVVGRHLIDWGWEVILHNAEDPQQSSPLTQKKRAEFLASKPRQSSPSKQPLLILDGLLGIGACGPLRPAYRKCADEMNRLRKEHRAVTIAIDLPSGLDGETGEVTEGCVEADFTLTIAHAKAGLLADTATPYVGRLELISLSEIQALPHSGDSIATLITPETLAPHFPPRRADHYKNQAGHVAIIAGSVGFTGAAALAAEACVTAGAGLVSLYVPEDVYSVLATRAIPEVMVQPLSLGNLTERFLLDLTADIIAFGPGLGAHPPLAYLEWLKSEPRPVIIDADGLNLIAAHQDQLGSVLRAGPRLLTPHPGEFRRLFPDGSTFPNRRTRAEAFVAKHPVTLLYKGARTIIASNDSPPLRYNTTGTPGMASGGMGDVLTGTCGALVAQGQPLAAAAAAGAWLCGRSAEMAISHGKQTQETLRATMVIEHFPEAIRAIHDR